MTVSLDIENLFTNILVNEAIKIIIENIYNHTSIPLPVMQPKIPLNSSLPVPQKSHSMNSPATYIYKLTVFQWGHHEVGPFLNSTCPTLKTVNWKQ